MQIAEDLVAEYRQEARTAVDGRRLVGAIEAVLADALRTVGDAANKAKHTKVSVEVVDAVVGKAVVPECSI